MTNISFPPPDADVKTVEKFLKEHKDIEYNHPYEMEAWIKSMTATEYTQYFLRLMRESKYTMEKIKSLYKSYTAVCMFLATRRPDQLRKLDRDNYSGDNIFLIQFNT